VWTRPVLVRSLVAVAAMITMLAAPAGAALRKTAERRLVVQGRVLSSSGSPMAGWPVSLIGTQRYIEFSRYSSGGQVATLASGTTDENGYFSFDLPWKRGFQYWFVRFADKEHLDPVRYVTPDDFEVTTEVRRGRAANVEMTIKDHPDWAEVERLIADAGGESTQRGGILRTLGLPEKRSRDEASGEEEWWYFTKGVLYTFRDGQPTGIRRFEPVAPPPGGAGGSGASR
jgi:hypothetical protein